MLEALELCLAALEEAPRKMLGIAYFRVLRMRESYIFMTLEAQAVNMLRRPLYSFR